MKKSFFFCLFLTGMFRLAFAQAPSQFNFQAVAKYSNDNPITGSASVRFSILDGSASGAELYQELHENVTATDKGVISLQVGSGQVQGLKPWSNINWSAGAKYLKVEIKPAGEPAYILMGQPQQMNSVPYALEAKSLELPFDKTTTSGTAMTLRNPSGTWAQLATPTEGGHFNGSVTLDNANLRVNNQGGHIEALVNSIGNAELYLSGNNATLAFQKDAASTTHTIILDAGAGYLNYNTTGGHSFFSNQGNINLLGNTDGLHPNSSQISFWPNSAGGGAVGMLGYAGSGSFQVANNGHLDYRCNSKGAGGYHNFYGGPLYVYDGPIYANGAAGAGLLTYTYLTSYCDNPVGCATDEQPYSLIAGNRILAAEFNARSDARIKKKIGLSNAAQDLATLLCLQVTDYVHKDVVAKGTASKKGFIAQEVEQVFSEAVANTTDFIPNVYRLASAVQLDPTAKTLTLTMDGPVDLTAGDRLRLLADQEYEVTVAGIDKNKIVVEGWQNPAPDRVFVFGKEVRDFKSVDYDRIFTLNVSATQELARQVASLQQQNDTLRQQFLQMESRLTALNAQLNPSGSLNK